MTTTAGDMTSDELAARPRAQRPVVAEVTGADPVDGVTIVAGPLGGPATAVRLHYPMRMVDPGMVALMRQAQRR